MRSTPHATLLALVLFSVPRWAAAAEPELPQGTVKQSAATAGTTELEGQGQFASAKQEAESDDVTELEVAAGGLLSTGNARALSVTGALRLRLRREDHQFSAGFAGNYGRAALDPDEDPETTVSNLQGQLRYDYYVHPRISLFAMATARHDPFQELELRLNIDPGLAVYILEDAKNRLWAEGGYDFQYEIRTDDVVFARDEDGMFLVDDGDRVRLTEKERFTHAVRLFAGYYNNINERVTFATGVEYLQSVLKAERWRLNWDNALTTNLFNKLAISLTFTVRVDNDPAPEVRKVDTITAVSLIYRAF